MLHTLPVSTDSAWTGEMTMDDDDDTAPVCPVCSHAHEQVRCCPLLCQSVGRATVVAVGSAVLGPPRKPLTKLMVSCSKNVRRAPSVRCAATSARVVCSSYCG